MELPRFDAFNQSLHFHALCAAKVNLTGVNLVTRLLAFLNLVGTDCRRATLERLGSAVRAEEPFTRLAVAFVLELVRIEADVNVVRVNVGHDEMIAAQVISRNAVNLFAQSAPADAHRLHRM